MWTTTPTDWYMVCLFPHSQGDSEEARALAKAIGEKMDQLERLLQLELTRKVAEDFKDPLGPLNALTKAALAPLGKR